jgi:hypothetical protein
MEGYTESILKGLILCEKGQGKKVDDKPRIKHIAVCVVRAERLEHDRRGI